MIAKVPSDSKEVKEPVVNEPIVIEMGKKNRKQVRKLKNGKPGRLMNRVEEAIERLREDGSMEPGAQPVVIVIRQRKKRKGGRFTKMWGLG